MGKIPGMHDIGCGFDGVECEFAAHNLWQRQGYWFFNRKKSSHYAARVYPPLRYLITNILLFGCRDKIMPYLRGYKKNSPDLRRK